MGARRSHTVSFDLMIPKWAQLIGALILSVGAVVAAGYSTFETTEQHDKDVQGIKELILEKDEADYQRYLDLQRRIDGLYHQDTPPAFASPAPDLTHA